MTETSTVLKPPGTAQLGVFKTNRRTRWWTAPLVQGLLFTI